MSLATARRQIVEIGRAFGARGWAPATSGNYSVRLDDGRIAITVSGRHKARLDESGVMAVDADGRSKSALRSSAETALHLQLFRLFPDIGAVLHTHSPAGVAFTRTRPTAGFTGHELLKAFPGVSTHDAAIELPIVDNDQNIAALAAKLEPLLLAAAPPPAYFIRGHGLYGWGRDMDEAERVIEAVEWLVAAELAEATFRAGARA